MYEEDDSDVKTERHCSVHEQHHETCICDSLKTQSWSLENDAADCIHCAAHLKLAKFTLPEHTGAK